MPLARTRSESFDVLVIEAVEHLGPAVGQRLAGVEFAVEDVPDALSPSEPADDVLEESGVPLSRIVRGGMAGIAGPVIVFYRRPIETRANFPGDLVGVVHDVVVMQIARYLNEEPEDIDPPGR